MMDACSRWGLLWRSSSHRHGQRESLLWDGIQPLIFPNRSAARQYSRRKYGYINTRPDLRAEPYGWRMPSPVHILGIQWRKA